MSELDAAEAIGEPDDAAESERRTSYLELFFDLVFVFAITEVTTMVPTRMAASCAPPSSWRSPGGPGAPMPG